MSPNAADPWNEINGFASQITEIQKRLEKRVSAFNKSVDSGAAEGTESSLAKMNVELRELVDLVVRAQRSVPRLSSGLDLAMLIESSARGNFTTESIVRVDQRVLVGHVTVLVSMSSSGDVSVRIGADEVQTTSVDHVIRVVGVKLRERFDPRAFAKALKEAHLIHCTLRGTDPAGIVVPLEDIRRIIGLDRQGTQSYSRNELTYDIQRLFSHGIEEMRLSGINLEPLPAARQQFEVLEGSGTVINLGGLRVSSPPKASRRQT